MMFSIRLLFSTLALLALFASGTIAQHPLIQPDNVKVTQGMTAALAGDEAEATRLFREAMEEDPGMAPPGLDVAGELARSGNSSRADKVMHWIEKTAEDFPNDPEAFLLLAELAVNERRYIEAGLLMKHAEPLVAAMPDDAARKIPLTGRSELVYVSMAENRFRWNEAAERLEKLLQRWPERTEFLFRLGRDQFKSGARDKGIETLRQWADQGQGRLLLSAVVGLYEEEGLREEALRYLDEALETESENFRVPLQASQLLLKWGDLEAARTHLAAAEKLAPNDPAVRRQLGIIALYDEDNRKAERLLEPLLTEYPGDMATRSGLVLALCSQDDAIKLQQAKRLAEEMYHARPGDMEAVASMALVHLWSGEMLLAERMLAEQFDRGEMNSVGAYYMAVIMDRNQQPTESLIFLDAALQTGINFPQRKAAEKLRDRLREPLP